ncbi:hypothetical protein G6F64_014484 [Rhizopus arrhizus]|uniref:Uncharacterized protein n=1 Tax=Rhizopus oryzae TaxID=64495 RepID=A0A9P6WTD7_RHIOR|nr:hypothetical protein G6F64_014484 [Rhizopus arrhizus]
MIQAVRGSMARAAASPATTGLDCMMTLPLLSVTRSIRGVTEPAPSASGSTAGWRALSKPKRVRPWRKVSMGSYWLP